MNIGVANITDAVSLASLDQSQPFSAHWSEANWRSELTYPAACVWCMSQQTQLVGFIAVRGAAGQYEITNLAVDKNWLRQGIATALLSQALHTTKAQQFTLEVSEHNHPARALYKKNGFTEVGRRHQFYPDGADAILMERCL